MGKGVGDSSWARKWFAGKEKDGLQQCIFVDSEGKRCTYMNNCRYCTALASHLRKHDVDRNSSVPKTTMKSLEEYWKEQCPPLDSNERWILLLARRGFPATLLDDAEFRDLTKTKLSRNWVPKMMEELSQKLMGAALSFVKEGTLAIDVGTVHRRFLAFVLVSKGKSLILKLKEDVEAGGVLTIEVVYNETQRVVTELRSKGIHVRNIVADNASNLQGISKYTPDGDVAEVGEVETDDEDDLKMEISKLPLVTRCVCHVIQLIVKDVSSIWQSAYDSAKTILAHANVKRTACETRWNSKYMVIKDAISHCEGNDQRELEEAAEFLRPFAVMTRALESDSATLFQTVATVEKFFRYLQDQQQKLSGSPLGRLRAQALTTLHLHSCKRFAMLFNTPYVILAFFSPSTDYNATLTIAMEPTVRAEMEKLDNAVAVEWKIFAQKQIDPLKDTAVTKEIYEAHIVKHFSSMPAIAKVVRGLLHGVPSEAAVERMFSQLKFTFDQWRSRSSNALMNNTLQITSAYRYFNSKWFDQPNSFQQPVEPEVMNTPKRHRAESMAATTPTTTTGDETPREVHELESGSDDEEDFAEASEVHALFDQILKWAFERQHQAQAAPSPAAEGSRKTRLAADACIDCGKPCRLHPNLGYLECQVCHARRSVTHLPRFQNMQGSNQHEKMDVNWVCEKCAKLK